MYFYLLISSKHDNFWAHTFYHHSNYPRGGHPGFCLLFTEKRGEDPNIPFASFKNESVSSWYIKLTQASRYFFNIAKSDPTHKAFETKVRGASRWLIIFYSGPLWIWVRVILIHLICGVVCFYQNGRGQHFWESGEGVGKMKVVRRVKDGDRGGNRKSGVAMGVKCSPPPHIQME